MRDRNRREFLADVGRGMLVASVGSVVAQDLGLARVLADDKTSALSFGAIEPLVCLMQDTPIAKLLPALVARLHDGTDLRTLVAAGALANARTFGGQDYDGYHAFMALAPSYEMARDLPEAQRALPVLKVLYRNTNRIHAVGGRKNEHLAVVAAAADTTPTGEMLREATRAADFDRAERTFAAIARGPVGEAFNHLQFSVQDEVDVHRVVLAWRAWALLDLTGQEQAHTLLRQSVRYCVNTEQNYKKHGYRLSPIRTVLPQMLDQYKLLSKAPGTRAADDAWIERMSTLLVEGSREQAADAVAAALAEGMSPESIGEAMSLAGTMLVLRDPGRKESRTPTKPPGSVHGDSVGVHASDAANAWRNIARVSNPRNVMASLIVGAFHTAGQGQQVQKEPYPLAEQREKVTARDAETLLRQTEGAIRDKDQARVCALVQRYGEQGHAERPIFDLLLRYAISEDGALHAEKYYRTVSEEFARSRPAFRWRHLVALARVTASEYGYPAPGYAEAKQLIDKGA